MKPTEFKLLPVPNGVWSNIIKFACTMVVLGFNMPYSVVSDAPAPSYSQALMYGSPNVVQELPNETVGKQCSPAANKGAAHCSKEAAFHRQPVSRMLLSQQPNKVQLAS